MREQQIKHLLGIEGLNRDEILHFVNSGSHFAEIMTRDIKKVPALRGKTIVNLFLEPSTRTRSSFEIAGKILSADTINIGASDSSTTKGETLLDTAKTIEAMCPDILVMRHKESGAPHFLAKHLKNTAVVNAGDGLHEHPSQALLDLLTMKQHFESKQRPLTGLKIAIVGDVRHSRVARSNLHAHIALGNQVTLVGPETLVPNDFLSAFNQKIKISRDMSGIEGADVVMCLRMQLERMDGHFVPNLEEYSREFGVNERLLKRYAPNCIVLHPGPANRGIEVSSEVLDGPRSMFRKQVNNGVAARMAVLFSLATFHDEEV